MARSRFFVLLASLCLALSSNVGTHDGELHCPCTLFDAAVPAVVDVGPDSAVELGVKFRPERDGYITGIRFYKSQANAGPHFGRLWAVDGTALGSVNFQNETASGWQEARFGAPIAVQAGVTYVASYNAPNGHYAFTADYFLIERHNGPLIGLASSPASGNGVFIYGSEVPRFSYRAANYWVDVIFEPPTTAPPAVLATLPAAGATNAALPITATFNRDMAASSIVMRLQRADGSLIAGTVTYDAASRVADFSPASPLGGATTYTATVEGSAITGEALPAPYSWSFTTAAVGFKDTVVLSGLQQPTTFRFAPGGGIFVAEKSGIIKVFQDFNDTTPVIFADLRTEVHNFWDRGLLGLTLHPQFPAQPYVYVAYSRDAVIGGEAPLYGTPGTTSDGCATAEGALTDGCIISARVSRLRAVAVADGYQMTGAEEVLVEGWGQQYPSHSIGALEFGADGALYVTGGEGASYSFVDYGQRGNPPNPLGDSPVAAGEAQTPPSAEGGALRSQSLQRASGGPVLLNGMVLRIDPNTGAGLPDNPLGSSADANARRVLAEGLRNPYRFTIKPGTTEVWVGDVGWNAIEEINRVPARPNRVLNFGWPCYEGALPQPAYESTGLAICQSLYATIGSVDRPAFEYDHWRKLTADDTCGTGSSSIAGLAFYEGGTYPSTYNGALFFADYARRCIWAALPDASGQIDFTRPLTILNNAENPVELRAGLGGDLFYVDIGWGTIHRIQYLTSSEQQTLAASFSATPRSGAAPLTVQFDGRASIGSDLTYRWDFGDGSDPVIAGAQVSHTYAIGDYIARLTVMDGAGATAVATTSITVTSPPPAPVIDMPLTDVRWSVGDTVSFSGHATDPQDGALAAAQLSWSVVMNHCSDATHCHAHTLQDYPGIQSGSFTAPDHEYPSYIVLTLTARNSRDVTASTSVRLDPRVVTLSFATEPAGLSLAIGSETAATPFARTVIVGSVISASAGATQILNGSSYKFVQWSDGGALTHDIVAPSTNTTITASYAQQSSPASSLFGSALPAVPDAGADNPVELGVKFRADVSGAVTGIRFYKGAGNIGTHVGSLWSATGTRLAFVTFTGETASGWQEARFGTPVNIAANSVYVVSYHTTGGHYSYTSSFFAAPHDAGVLHAPASAASANGVFAYGPAGTFPANGYNATNYWVDLLFTSVPDTIAPTIATSAPAANAVEVPRTEHVKVTFSESMHAPSILADTVVVTTESGTRIPGTVTYDDATRTVTFAPGAALQPSTRYSVRVAGGTSAAAARDCAGNPLQADVTWSFTTAAAAGDGCPCSLFPATLSPAIADAGADSPVELGVKFSANASGTILGVRFLKHAANTGTHVGSLWTASGTRLAYATFTTESASGWQEVRFSAPVAITAGSIYVASYHSTGGHYSLTSGFFNTAWTNGPLTAPASTSAPNGVFAYGGVGQFPTATYGASNYFVDVLFTPDAADTTPPVVTATSPAASATDVALTSAISATFNEPIDAASLTATSFAVRDAANVTVAGAIGYDSVSRTARFTPSAPLAGGTVYTVTLAGAGSTASASVRDTSGNAMADDVEWTFTTASVGTVAGDECPCSLWNATAVPAVADGGSDASVELGVKFRTGSNGYIRGIRFYKSAANTGAHVVSLWTATGALLAQAAATNESASGWQEASFALPVAVTADTVYVASYHVNGGHYSYTGAYFNGPRDAGVLHAPAGANGVFAYHSSSTFPSSSYNNTNYWVDVVFTR